MPATHTAHPHPGIAACWAILNGESDPLRAFWDLRLDYPERRFFLIAARLPEYWDWKRWDDLKQEQRNAIHIAANHFKEWCMTWRGADYEHASQTHAGTVVLRGRRSVFRAVLNQFTENRLSRCAHSVLRR